MKVNRPKLTSPPQPPDILVEWLISGWEDPFQEPKFISSRNESNNGISISVRFDSDSERVAARENWEIRRKSWAENEKPARRAMYIFEKVYDLYGMIQKESEKIQIMLGDGILNWRLESGGIHCPVLLQRIQLEFDPEIPEFTFMESNRNPEYVTRNHP